MIGTWVCGGLLRRVLVAAAFIVGVGGASGARAQSEPTLEQRLARLCEDLDQRRLDLHISGLSLAVVKDDRVVLARGFGLRDRERKVPADEQTLYGIGSTTKAFTAMLCAMLVDEGKLSFADRPQKFLPWFKFKDATADANATLRDLLCHRTGLTRNDVAWVGTEASREELLRSVAEMETNRTFRSAWQYNNCMFLCAGECAAAIEGRSWDELVAARIFAPLGMKRSVTSGEAARADPLLSGRYDWDATKKEFTPVDWMGVDNMAPAGSICSTVVDMAQWVRFLLKRGEHDGKRLVSDAQFDELWKDDDALDPSYGLGWFLHDLDPLTFKAQDGSKHRVIEHGGNVAGYAAEVGLLPDLHMGLVLLTNTSGTQLQGGILPFVWNALAGPWTERRKVVEGTALPEEATRSWLGVYTEGKVGVSLRTLRRTDDHLVLVLPSMPGQVADTFFTLLWPGDDGRAWLKEEPDSFVTFERDASGRLLSLTLVQGDLVRTMRPQKPPQESQPPDLTLDDLMAKRAEATGIENAAGWKTLRLTGTLRFPQAGVKGRYVVTTRGRDALRIDFDAGKFGRSSTIVVGGRGTVVAHLGSTPELPAARAATLAFANPLVESGPWLDDAEDVELVRLGPAPAFDPQQPGELCLAVRVKPFGADPIVYHVSCKDWSLVAVEGATALPGVPSSLPVARLSDLRDVRGVKLSFRREFGVPDVGRMEIQFDRAEVDVELPAGFFDLPPAPAPKGAGS